MQSDQQRASNYLRQRRIAVRALAALLSHAARDIEDGGEVLVADDVEGTMVALHQTGAAMLGLARSMARLPSLVRMWWRALERPQQEVALRYVRGAC